MPPNQPQQPPASPPPDPSSSPNPDYNFIFNGEQKPKKRLNISLPFASRLPRPVAYVIIAAIALIIIIPIVSAIFSKPSNSDQLIKAAAKAQEIVRISDLVQQQTKDPNTQTLAITTSSSLTSDEIQIKNYLASHHTKVSAKSLLIYLNKNTDKSLQTAIQTNSLEQAYASYLKNQLTDYKNYLQEIYAGSPAKAKIILKQAFNSTQVILSAQQIANSSS